MVNLNLHDLFSNRHMCDIDTTMATVLILFITLIQVVKPLANAHAGPSQGSTRTTGHVDTHQRVQHAPRRHMPASLTCATSKHAGKLNTHHRARQPPCTSTATTTASSTSSSFEKTESKNFKNVTHRIRLLQSSLLVHIFLRILS